MSVDTVREYRMLMEQSIRSRQQHIGLVGYGPETNYGVVLFPNGMGGFSIATRATLIGFEEDVTGLASGATGLTYGMLRALAREVVYVWGNTSGMIEVDNPYAHDSELVTEFEILLMCYPHGARPPKYSSFQSTVFPEFMEHEPLVLTIAKRPVGWPR